MYNAKSIDAPYEVVFDECKHGSESLPIKKLRRALQTRDIRTSVSRHNISSHTLSEGRVYVLFDPQQPLTIDEFAALKAFLTSDSRNALAVFLSEGGEAKNNTNVNYLLEEFGIVANNDCVIRQNFHKYTHPKECLIPNTPLPPSSGSSSLLFPFGCTLNIQPPAVTLLASGATSYPVNRPVVGASESGQLGRVVVVGASAMFSDVYIDYEQNVHFALYLFDCLLGRRRLTEHIVNEGGIYEYQYLPNLVNTSEQLRPCLLEPPKLPLDVAALSKRPFYQYTNTKLPEVLKLLEKIPNIKFQPLTLIQPKFNLPLPELQPAVYPATLEDIGGPALELFDLDDALMPPNNRLAQLANQCGHSASPKDLDFFVTEAAKLLGFPANVRDAGPQAILAHLFATVADFKKFRSSFCVSQIV